MKRLIGTTGTVLGLLCTITLLSACDSTNPPKSQTLTPSVGASTPSQAPASASTSPAKFTDDVSAQAALARLSKEYDAFNKWTTYSTDSTTHYVGSGQKISLDGAIYIDSKPTSPIFSMSYVAPDWLFINDVILKSGEDVETIDFTSPLRDVLGSGNIVEALSFHIDATNDSIILKGVKSGDLAMRFEGDKGNVDITLDAKDIQMIRTLLGASQALKVKF
jgi:hypothetical protein